ncbi:helix-turn-helix transcriptional regulator [Dehalobacter sp.]|uniref:helix-turn-helix transcriptional regulator n=1 Tax=Dehalobacter sp. TaxID=1962289 RepID=UPI00258301DB|nr:helix-turn-helix transcriptional regulator [Dehalobacter sp.]MDJ0304750.1 helix-turn-helix transcriptional regulator [Dehalobacter sp.]
MVPNMKYIQDLVFKQGWSQTEFANELGMSRAEVNRLFNGRRKGGTKLAGNLIRVFPNEPIDKLFFLHQVLPVGK